MWRSSSPGWPGEDRRGQLAGRGRRGGSWVEDCRVLRNVKILELVGVILSAVTKAIDKDEVVVESEIVRSPSLPKARAQRREDEHCVGPPTCTRLRRET